jgi:mannose-6-phosphate isomerase-like protein (cupin superfamily)
MRLLAGLISFGRFAFGVAFIAQPGLMERAWIGKLARVPGVQLLARAVGARDLVLGLGGLQAVARDDGSARPWLGAAAICDAVDFGATWTAGRTIPREPRRGVLAVASAFSLLSAIAAVGVGRVGSPKTGRNTRRRRPMATAESKPLDQPDETRPVDKGKVEVVALGPGAVMRTTFEPGWRWSECIKPIVGGDSCQVDHFGYCISGHMHVQMDDGEEFDVRAGDAMRIPPGHDAWVVGDDPYVGVDFQGGAEFAKPS